MALAVEQSSTFSRRSYSSPNLLSFQALENQSSPAAAGSLDLLPLSSKSDFDSSFEIPSFDSDLDLDISLSFSTKSASSIAKSTAPLSSRPSPVAEPAITSRIRSSTSVGDRPRSWLATFTTPRVEERRPATSVREINFSNGPSDSQAYDARSQAKPESYAGFAKLSWKSSRSPSFQSRPESPSENTSKQESTLSQGKLKRTMTPKRQDLVANQADPNPTLDPSRPSAKGFTRANSYLAKIKQKPTTTTTTATSGTGGSIGSNLSCASSATSLAQPGCTSIDTHATQSTCSESNSTAPTTDDSSSEMPPRTLDPLWSQLKMLDMEHRAFVSKPMIQKVAQVQTLILPFLKSAISQAPIRDLRPEDVDGRATVFSKWWGAILDMLDGQYQQPVPGVDRPALLEALTLIMMRPEWRQTTTYFLPLSDRSPRERVRKRSWTNSSDSSHSSNQSAMLAESAEHNVRTMFVSNLVKQMAFVVEKLSLRHAPLSLVNFAGKTCAYAFFFAPGVSDILLRLWGLTPDLIRRASDDFGLPRKDSGESEDIVALFPPKIGAYGWTSPRGIWDTLKNIPKMPMLVARIPWTGPWVARWKGRDTDLFFIFCKYFHVLSDQFMPSGLPLTEKARAPAFVLVHAQLLSIIDSTIHRQTAFEGAYPPLTDSDGADAALSMPLPPSNLLKGMAENRLVRLLKDVLSDDAHEFTGARHTFAESFAALLRAATCRTSQYNCNACFTLCDFLEEVLMIYNQFETTNTTSYIDWPFWFDVFKKVLSSLNTMSEVRMLSLIFTIWDAIAKDSKRKLILCRDWLLTEETFNAFFNNWCPMVRAYYQRLLCWRICRDKGSLSETDIEIFLLVTERLKTVWSHYLYLKDSAEMSGRVAPSTAAMLPTLGKRFIIIREEVSAPQPGLVMGFDSFARTSNADLIPGDGISDAGFASKIDPKKRWSLLKMLSFNSVGQNGSTDGGSAHRNSIDEFQNLRRETAEARSRPIPPPKSAKSMSGSSDTDSGRSSPTFDEPRYCFKFILAWQQPPIPPRERILVRPRLPIPAQARVSARSRSGSPLPTPGKPAPVRSFSGSPQGGLVQAARNASPLNSPSLDQRRRGSLTPGRSSEESWSRAGSQTGSGTTTPSEDRFSPSPGIQYEPNAERYVEPTPDPIKPVGVFANNTVYSGRALAEWSLVVAECNNFVERRRDEGILGLSDIEVPQLNVEGFRKIGG